MSEKRKNSKEQLFQSLWRLCSLATRECKHVLYAHAGKPVYSNTDSTSPLTLTRGLRGLHTLITHMVQNSRKNSPILNYTQSDSSQNDIHSSRWPLRMAGDTAQHSELLLSLTLWKTVRENVSWFVTSGHLLPIKRNTVSSVYSPITRHIISQYCGWWVLNVWDLFWLYLNSSSECRHQCFKIKPSLQMANMWCAAFSTVLQE